MTGVAAVRLTHYRQRLVASPAIAVKRPTISFSVADRPSNSSAAVAPSSALAAVACVTVCIRVTASLICSTPRACSWPASFTSSTSVLTLANSPVIAPIPVATRRSTWQWTLRSAPPCPWRLGHSAAPACAPHHPPPQSPLPPAIFPLCVAISSIRHRLMQQLIGLYELLLRPCHPLCRLRRTSLPAKLPGRRNHNRLLEETCAAVPLTPSASR